MLKKTLILISILTFSVFAVSCGNNKDDSTPVSQEEPIEDTADESDNAEASSEDDDKSDTQQDSQNETGEVTSGIYTLSTDTGDKSVVIKTPENYQPTDALSDIWLSFTTPASNGNGTAQYVMYLLSDDSGDIEANLKQEVTYTASANADGDADFSDIQNETKGNFDIVYFSYAYSSGSEMTEGCKAWTTLENGAVLITTLEVFGSDIEAVDTDSFINEMIDMIEETE